MKRFCLISEGNTMNKGMEKEQYVTSKTVFFVISGQGKG